VLDPVLNPFTNRLVGSPLSLAATFSIVSIVLTACGSDVDAGPGLEHGERVYSNPIDGGNTFTCGTCHAVTEPADDGLRRPGHPLGDATRRPSYKNGQVSSFLEAANSCLVEWMNAPVWSEEDEDYQAVFAFLDAGAPASAPALTFEVVQPPPEEALAGGDAAAGRAVFNESCAVCHGQDGVGTERALPVAERGLDPTHVAARVRTSGRTGSSVYDGLTGGIMPFWAADRLSDEELRDIIAWLEVPPDDDTSDDGGTGDDGGTTGDGGDDGPFSDCPETHAKIGQMAVLVGHSHGVSGVAEIVDDCTIVLREFHFDGAGIDVRAYGGLGGNYQGGFSMSEDLVKSGGYENAELVFTLPPGQTLDDLDGISIWCVPVGVDFGSGLFTF
jgi:mono/diheme cytochrome c family protein